MKNEINFRLYYELTDKNNKRKYNRTPRAIDRIASYWLSKLLDKARDIARLVNLIRIKK